MDMFSSRLDTLLPKLWSRIKGGFSIGVIVFVTPLLVLAQASERSEQNKANLGNTAGGAARKSTTSQNDLEDRRNRELELKKQAFDLALKTQNSKNVHKFGIDYADALVAANKRNECTTVLKKAAACLRVKSADSADMSDLYQRQMVNYFEQGETQLADACRDNAIAINSKVRPISDPTAWTYFLAADQQLKSNHYVAAMQYFERARASFTQLQPSPLATRDCYFVDVKEARIGICQGDFKQAIKLLARALPHLEKFPEPFFTPSMYIDLANSYQKVGDQTRQQQSLKRAYEMAKRSQPRSF